MNGRHTRMTLRAGEFSKLLLQIRCWQRNSLNDTIRMGYIAIIVKRKIVDTVNICNRDVCTQSLFKYNSYSRGKKSYKQLHFRSKLRAGGTAGNSNSLHNNILYKKYNEQKKEKEISTRYTMYAHCRARFDKIACVYRISRPYVCRRRRRRRPSLDGAVVYSPGRCRTTELTGRRRRSFFFFIRPFSWENLSWVPRDI